MKFLLRFADKLVGLFVLVALLALMAALIFVGSNRRWFQPELVYHSRFRSAVELSPGMPLELRGFEVGHLSGLSLGKDDRVEVRLAVYPEFADRIRPGTVVELAVHPLGLGSDLILYPGTRGGEPLPEGSFLPSTDEKEGRELLLAGAADEPEVQDSLADTLAGLPELVTNFDEAARTLTGAIQGLERALLGDAEDDGGALGDFERTFQGTDRLVQDLRGVAGDLNRVTSGLADLVEGLGEPEGLVTRLLAPEGSLEHLLRDQGELYDSLRGSLDELHGSLSELRSIVAYVHRSTPQLSALMEEATAALNEGEKVMEGLRNNPLLRGGITEEENQPATLEGYRGEEF